MAYDPILLVEDDENDVFILKRALERARIVNPIIAVRDGLEAINYLKGMGSDTAGAPTPPLLLLLDIKMPIMGGFEVLEWIRKQPRLNRVVVIVFSSSRHPADIARAYDLHANSFLVKRSSVEETTELLRSLHNYWLCWNEKPNLEVVLTRTQDAGS
jgi:CheY-like chemotaxis protein